MKVFIDMRAMRLVSEALMGQFRHSKLLTLTSKLSY